ncbi:MAG: hypothetical protein GX640_03400 [Fibrobacter sp.]|nr:hypothetical protein [Fibrobacter sp.]
MKIAYFITAHGYGHGVRSCSIINQISPDVEIVLRTALPQQFFLEELKHPFEICYADFDCGCIQSDSITVDIEETLRCYRKISADNRRKLESEVRWCKENRIDLIVSDITPFAFDIAASAGIPSAAISNFTWYDIYGEYLGQDAEFRPVLDEMYNQYRKADIMLALSPPLPMNYFKQIVKIPLVGRTGVDKREQIYEKYQIEKGKKIGLIYVGDFGMNDAAWKNLETFTEWEFLGLHSIPGKPKNYHLVNKNLIGYQDLTASVDVVISKIGYGVVAECMLNGTPLIYLPRDKFAEYPVLEASVQNWGGGYLVPVNKFFSLNWEDALNTALSKGRLERLSSDGARFAARELENLL